MEEKKIIPLSKIDPVAREIAVRWVESFQTDGGIELEQKHKLASDIMNYAISLVNEQREIMSRHLNTRNVPRPECIRAIEDEDEK